MRKGFSHFFFKILSLSLSFFKQTSSSFSPFYVTLILQTITLHHSSIYPSIASNLLTTSPPPTTLQATLIFFLQLITTFYSPHLPLTSRCHSPLTTENPQPSTATPFCATTNFEHHHNSPGRFLSKKENIEKMQKKVLQVFSLQPSNYNYAAGTTVFYSIVFLFHFLLTWFKHVLSCFSLEIFFIIVVFQSDMLFWMFARYYG